MQFDLATYYIHNMEFMVSGDEGIGGEVDDLGFHTYDVFDKHGETISDETWDSLPSYEEVKEFLAETDWFEEEHQREIEANK